MDGLMKPRRFELELKKWPLSQSSHSRTSLPRPCLRMERKQLLSAGMDSSREGLGRPGAGSAAPPHKAHPKVRPGRAALPSALPRRPGCPRERAPAARGSAHGSARGPALARRGRGGGALWRPCWVRAAPRAAAARARPAPLLELGDPRHTSVPGLGLGSWLFGASFD